MGMSAASPYGSGTRNLSGMKPIRLPLPPSLPPSHFLPPPWCLLPWASATDARVTHHLRVQVSSGPKLLILKMGGGWGGSCTLLEGPKGDKFNP